MKICMIELVQNGGMVHYASQLSNALVNLKNMDVHMIVPDGINESLFNQGIHLLKIPSIGRHGYRIDLILRYIYKINPDVIHITMLHPFLIPILPMLEKYPLIVTTHEVIPHPGDSVIVAKLTTLAKKRFATINFVHSNSIKEDLMRVGFNETNIKVVPHGDYSFLVKYANKNQAEEKNTILFFGRILDYKGLEYLIKGESLLSRDLTDFKIIIAGDGDLSKYQKMIKNKDNFEILNKFIPDEEIPILFQRSSVVVLPYIEASQSGIIPIAYAFRKPVVVTNVGNLSDVVIDGVTGYIVPPKDTDSLILAVSKILKNSKLKYDMGEHAYKLMTEKMSWDAIGKTTVEIYSNTSGCS